MARSREDECHNVTTIGAADAAEKLRLNHILQHKMLDKVILGNLYV